MPTDTGMMVMKGFAVEGAGEIKMRGQLGRQIGNV